MAQRCGRAVGLLAVALVMVVTGCAGEEPDDGTTGSAEVSGPTRTVEPTQSGTVDPRVAVPEGSGCEPGPGALPDGQWFGTVVGLTTDELHLDLACWFIGQDATMAAEEDGAESPPPDDFYVRDTSEEVRTVPVGPDASVVMYPTGSPQERTGTVAELVAVAETRDGFPFGVWIEVSGGVVVGLQEQWVP